MFKLINYRLTRDPWDDSSTQFTHNDDSNPESEDDEEENVSMHNSEGIISEHSESYEERDLYS